MWRIGLRALAVYSSLLVAGCTPEFPKEPADPATEISNLRKEIRETNAQLASERDKNAILSANVKELSDRDRQLSSKLQELKLANEQQEKLIETLRTAPAERDTYRTRVEVLTLELNRLAGKIIELKRQIVALEKTANERAMQATSMPAER